MLGLDKHSGEAAVLEQSLLIIGGGIAGLTAGCYGRMNGYRTTILEQHTLPGGLCTSWERQGYTFDYSIAYLMGVAPGTSLNRMWAELGALTGRNIQYYDEFGRIRSEDGRELIVYTDPDKLERHLLELAPVDAKRIQEFTGAIRTMTRHPMEPPEKPTALMSFGERVKQIWQFMPLGKLVSRYGPITTEEWAREFQDPFLRQALGRVFTWPRVPMLGVIMALSTMHARTAGRPEGGALAFARDIERRYRELGGEIRYRARVEEILVESDRAVGARLANGAELRADIVISAADGYRTIFGLLGGKYIDARILGFYRDLPAYKPLVTVSFGVNRDLSAAPLSVVYPSERPVLDAGERPQTVWVKHFCADQTMAPAGKSTVMLEYVGDYAYWKQLHADPLAYRTEKNRVAAAALAFLEQQHPGIRSQVEVIDVATPVTAERYTANREGSPMGWSLPITRETSALTDSGMTRTLPGLANFYMTGQWAPSGGVPAVATWSRHLIQLICHAHGKPFVTSVPAPDEATRAAG
jgi:phytoene dehydrogenase-like protein